MTTRLQIYDETTSGESSRVFALDIIEPTISVRELIRRRVYEEVMDHNQAKREVFKGLIQPTDTEKVLNGFKLKRAKKIDWEEQYELAIKAFGSNGFFILVDDDQVENLDQDIHLKADTKVSFVKLVPLVGG